MEKFLDYCRYYGLGPDEVFSLYALTSCANDEDVIKTFISSLESLTIHGFIEYAPNVTRETLLKQKFKLTDKGENALKNFQECMPVNPVDTKATFTGSSKLQKTKLDEFINDYRDLFPSGHIASKPYKGTPGELKNRLAWFKKSFPEYWDFELMLKATKAYFADIDRRRENKIKTAPYFIRKREQGHTDVSMLADWCMLVKDGLIDDQKKLDELNKRYNPDDGIL